MNKDVVVVGAGPAGLLTALHIRNRDVLLLEEHGKVGVPKHCAGIIGKFVAEEISKISPRLLDNSYKKIVFLVEKKKYTLSFKRPIAYHINRPLLEEVLASRVESHGHRMLYNAKSYPLSTQSIKTKDSIITYDTLVVSDGALSVFRKKLIGDPQDYLHGIQILARVNELPDNTLIIYYTPRIPEFFSWIIPLDTNLAKIGFASKKPREELLIKQVEKNLGIKVSSILEKFGGLIPIHRALKDPVYYNKIVFHGDAVPLIKPYTGGGLHNIFKYSPILARFIDEKKLKDYSNYYKKAFYVRNIIEYYITKFLKITRYYLPVPLVARLVDLGLFDYNDFDEHYRLLIKTISLGPILPFILF